MLARGVGWITVGWRCGVGCVPVFWIPAFAGMTDPRAGWWYGGWLRSWFGIPAFAGVTARGRLVGGVGGGCAPVSWIPAFAGMTGGLDFFGEVGYEVCVGLGLGDAIEDALGGV